MVLSEVLGARHESSVLRPLQHVGPICRRQLNQLQSTGKMERTPASPSRSLGPSASVPSHGSDLSHLVSGTVADFQDELVQWLNIDHLGSSLRRKILKRTEVIVLKVDVVELFSSFPTLAGAILQCPEIVGKAIVEHIVSINSEDLALQDVLLQSRIHIRWLAVPLPVFKSIQEVLDCVLELCSSPGYPVQVLGVVTQISSLRNRTHIRKVRCQSCGKEHLCFEDLPGTSLSCCGASFEEDISSRVEVTYQVI